MFVRNAENGWTDIFSSPDRKAAGSIPVGCGKGKAREIEVSLVFLCFDFHATDPDECCS